MAKEAVNIPVTGNGDVKTREDAENMLTETGCDMVMIGRGIYGKPWLFSEIADKDYIATAGKKWDIIRRHYGLILSDKPEIVAVREMRKHLIWYSKGLPGAAEFRKKIVYLDDPEEAIQAAAGFWQSAVGSR